VGRCYHGGVLGCVALVLAPGLTGYGGPADGMGILLARLTGLCPFGNVRGSYRVSYPVMRRAHVTFAVVYPCRVCPRSRDLCRVTCIGW
jgi:hypothetical protein